MATILEQGDATTVAVKAASYSGAGISIGTALTLTDWGIIVGIATALLTFGLNVWWVRNKHAQGQRREAREIEEHNARMRQLGVPEEGLNRRRQGGKISPKLAAMLAGLGLTLAGGLITTWESGPKRPLTAYQDVIGVWTICDGLTRGVKRGDRETEDGCDERLFRELKSVAGAMDACLKQGVPDGARAAAISLAYNAGAGAVCKSTMVRRLNAGDLQGGCDELRRWVYAGGRRLQGLANRREAERRVCLGLAA